MKFLISFSLIIFCFTSRAETEIPYHWGSDPFQSSPGFIEKEDGSDELVLPVLDAIIFDKTEPVAIVNGYSVFEGTYIDNYLVKAIGENFIVLKKGIKTIDISLPKAEKEESFSEVVEERE